MTDKPQFETASEYMTDEERAVAFKAEFETLKQKWGCNFSINFPLPQILFEPTGLPQMTVRLEYKAIALPGYRIPKPVPSEQKIPIAEAPIASAKEPAAK